ncbi:hypothetical protein OIU77_007851 [Salix suchowensis]|uniref:Uncharacterized protein n=1 Tax=Salix suchowensis TaxID=1278906 RepID=A0ABQ9AHK5_9ROSI|nr:hypothetical protein OIU77_007851 [Salix suchowensis]
MEAAANMGKKRSEELVKHVAELNEAILVSKIASTEAAKEQCLQLSVEAEAEERENQSLKGSDKATEGSEDFGLMHTDEYEKYSCQDVEAFQKNEPHAESVKRRSENDGNITISLEEYESLNRKAAKADEFIRREPSNMSITS